MPAAAAEDYSIPVSTSDSGDSDGCSSIPPTTDLQTDDEPKPDTVKPAVNAEAEITRIEYPDGLKITWQPVTEDQEGNPETINYYEIHRGTQAKFAVSEETKIAEAIALEYIDTQEGIIGDPSVQYYYALVAVDTAGNKAEQEIRVGEYDFELVHNTDKTSINLISLPFVLPEDLVMASDLSEYFGAAVDLISLWHAETQGYEDYIPIMPTWNDFELETGGVYFVSAKESKTITFIGVVPETAEPYELQINPDRGGANSIMAPLNRVDLKKASELWQEIQNIESLGYWSAETQEYVLYIPDEPSGDFEIKQGMAYSVDVSECTFWQP